MYVCMYVCMYDGCMHACMYVYIYISYVHIYIYTLEDKNAMIGRSSGGHLSSLCPMIIGT